MTTKYNHMKREIKFRVWTGLKMEYNIMAGFLGAFYVQGIDEKDSASMSPFNTKYGESPLMQFTGLKDKNGKEIYEGDILANYFKVEWNPLHCGWALFNHRGFCHELLADEYGLDGNSLDPWQITGEVIGNIYENPELLTKN